MVTDPFNLRVTHSRPFFFPLCFRRHCSDIVQRTRQHQRRGDGGRVVHAARQPLGCGGAGIARPCAVEPVLGCSSVLEFIPSPLFRCFPGASIGRRRLRRRCGPISQCGGERSTCRFRFGIQARLLVLPTTHHRLCLHPPYPIPFWHIGRSLTRWRLYSTATTLRLSRRRNANAGTPVGDEHRAPIVENMVATRLPINRGY